VKSARLYALKFPNGLIKFGRTSSTNTRWVSLSWQAGVSPIEVISSPPIEDIASAAEKWMLVRAKRRFIQAKGNEWFYGSNFGDAVNLIRQAHKRFATQECGWRHSNIWSYQFKNREVFSSNNFVFDSLTRVVRVTDRSKSRKVKASESWFNKESLAQ
jgi:hypothetical protein